MPIIYEKWYHTQAMGWDCFLDVYGNPAIFVKYPPGTTNEQAKGFALMSNDILSDMRGAFPAGIEIVTVETAARVADTFKLRYEECDKVIVRRGTGGELTVLSESGSGTLAGGAHADTFRRIAASEGNKISSSINKQLSRRILNEAFPNQKQLAYFSLDHAEVEDTTQVVNSIVALAGAGYRATDEEVTEKTASYI